MNQTDEHIDKLTRDLLKGTVEQPSSSLNARIMELIMSEKRMALRKCYIKKLPSVGTILVFFFIYLLIVAGGAMQIMKQPEAGETVLRSVKHLFPLLLTISSSVSVFFFFSQLDNWLRMKERMKADLQKK